MSDPAGVPAQELLLGFLAGEDGLLRIDDDDEIATVDVGGEGRFVFATEKMGSLSGYTAQGLVRCVKHIPFAGNFRRLCHSSGHIGTSKQILS